MSKPVASAGAGLAVGAAPDCRRTRRRRARSIVDERRERRAQSARSRREACPRASPARPRRCRMMPALRKHAAFVRRVDDDVGDEAGEVDVVRADGQEHEVEPAVGLGALRAGEEVVQLRHLGGRCARAGGAAAAIELARALAVEQADVDGRAGAGERQEGHGEVRVLDRERRARRAADGRRASGGRPRPSSAPTTAPIRSRSFSALPESQERSPLNADAAGTEIFVCRAARRSGGSRSLRRRAPPGGPDCRRPMRRSRRARRSGDRARRSRSMARRIGSPGDRDVDGRHGGAAVAGAERAPVRCSRH